MSKDALFSLSWRKITQDYLRSGMSVQQGCSKTLGFAYGQFSSLGTPGSSQARADNWRERFLPIPTDMGDKGLRKKSARRSVSSTWGLTTAIKPINFTRIIKPRYRWKGKHSKTSATVIKGREYRRKMGGPPPPP